MRRISLKTVIKSSRPRVAAYHLPDLIMGAAFPVIYFFAIGPAEHIPIWVKALFGFGAVTGAGISISALFKIFQILNADGNWKATLDQNKLLWETAIPNEGFPLAITISDISEAVQLNTFEDCGGDDKETSVTTTFELHMSDGSVKQVSQDTAGINPHRVCLALSKRGVLYRLFELDKTGDQMDAVRTVQKVY